MSFMSVLCPQSPSHPPSTCICFFSCFACIHLSTHLYDYLLVSLPRFMEVCIKVNCKNKHSVFFLPKKDWENQEKKPRWSWMTLIWIFTVTYEFVYKRVCGRVTACRSRFSSSSVCVLARKPRSSCFGKETQVIMLDSKSLYSLSRFAKP